MGIGPKRATRQLLAIALSSLSLSARADFAAYQAVVDLRAEGPGIIVTHHHDWSTATAEQRSKMIRTHQDPFRDDNYYAFLVWYGPDSTTQVRRTPSPALSWLGVTPDGRYVIGLSDVMLDNPYQVVVYDRSGTLLLKRHITPAVACLTPKMFSQLRRKHPAQFDELTDRTWTSGGTVYVDFEWMDAPRRLSSLWKALLAHACPSPFSPNFSESVTNWVFWFDRADPKPEVIEAAGEPVALRLRDPKGVPFELPFRLPRPAGP